MKHAQLKRRGLLGKLPRLSIESVRSHIALATLISMALLIAGIGLGSYLSLTFWQADDWV